MAFWLAVLNAVACCLHIRVSVYKKLVADGALSMPQAEVVCDGDFAQAGPGGECHTSTVHMFFDISTIVLIPSRGCSLPRDAERMFPNWALP